MNTNRFLTRVFDKQEKKMLYPGDGYLCIDNESINFGWNVGKNDFRELLFGDRFVPMMCSGGYLKSQQKHIYEYDIIEAMTRNFETPRNYVVYVENYAFAVVDCFGGKYSKSLLSEVDPCSVNLIGNCFANPDYVDQVFLEELLEVKA